MIQLKKTLLTLVALLAVTTGAWADDTTLFELSGWTATTGTLTFGNDGVVVAGNVNINENTEEIAGIRMKSDYNYDDKYYFTIKPATGSFKAGDKLSIAVCFNNIIDSRTAKAAIYAADGATLLYTTANGINGRNSAAAPAVEEYVLTQDADLLYIGRDGNVATYVTTLKVVRPSAPATAVTVAWDKAAKTGSFKMPGGNVTLEPEYFDQATVADGGVTAADADARATTDDPLVKVDATKLTGAKKLMYFVNNSGTTAPAYDAEGWTDQLPTAEGITQQGIVYVWYYPVGTDEGVDGATATYSDGDICLQSITARIAAEPTYAVTFADDLAEPDKWAADPATGVKKGTDVTVTYTGTRKVIGVKAEKKGGGEPVLLTTITAADNSSFKSGSQTFGDVATVTLTGNGLTNDGNHGGWYCQGSNLTATISVAEANGANITSVKFYTAGGGSAEDKDAPFEVTTTTVTSSNITTYLNGNSIGSYGVSKIEVYGTK